MLVLRGIKKRGVLPTIKRKDKNPMIIILALGRKIYN